MGKIVVSQFVTVDGVVEDPGGSENSDFGGWAFEFDRGEDGDKFKLDELMEADGLLLGRTTWEGFAEAWPSREGEFADKFNNMPKYVVSNTLTDPEWNNSHVISGDVGDGLAKLREGDESLLVNGSPRVVGALLDNDLLDELRMMVFPVVVGGGKTLFGDGVARKKLKLSESRPVGKDGVVILTYVPA